VYAAETRNIRVAVTPRFLPEQSQPRQGRFFWAYTVEIANEGQETVTLLARHWIITDGLGRRERVDGPGVVGEQPVIAPGSSYTYTSGCPLTTPDGTMQGAYDMITASGELFQATIPAFSLDSPYTQRVTH
jgi:ApaG protein